MKKNIPQHLTGKLLVTIFILNIIEFLQSGMIAFAATPIMGETGTSPEEFGLTNAIYAAIAIIMIAQQHWMVERLSWRRYIQIGLSFFVVGALVCFFSHSFYSFLSGRAIMALGGASFMTSARIVSLLLPAGRTRLVAIKAFVVSMTLGMSLAPWLASIIVSYDRWNLLFILLILLAILAFIFASSCLPTNVLEPKDRVTKSHPLLIIMLLFSGFSFFYVFRRSNYDFYSNFIMLLSIFMIAFMCLIIFIYKLRQIKEKPLLRVRPIFDNKAFVFSTIMACAYYIMNAANNYILPMLLQKGLNFPWSSIGFFMSLGLSMSIFSWFIYIKIVIKSPNMKKFCLIGGLAIIFYGWNLSNITPQSSMGQHILPAMLANGIFVIMFMSPLTGSGLRALQQDDLLYTHAMQIRNMIAQLAISLGVTLGTVMMQWRTTFHFSVLGEHYQENNPAFVDALQKLIAALSRSMPPDQAEPAALYQLQQMMYQQSTVMASADYFYGVMIFGIVATSVVLLQRIIK